MRNPADQFRKLVRALVALLVGLALLAPQTALASGDDVWADCGDADGTINHKHSQADYTDALKNPPADGAEYSPCLDLIRAAQIRDASGGSSGGSGAAGAAGGSGGGGTGGGGAAVSSEDLSKALKGSGIDASGAVTGAGGDAAQPVTVDGQQIDLSAGRLPSIASALSLPLPIAASAVVVLLSAALPLVRYIVARFGGTSPPPAVPASTTP